MRIKLILVHGVLITICILMISPIIWMLLSSFKAESEILSIPPTLFPKKWDFQGYGRMFETAPWFKYFFNTMYVAILNIIGQILVSSLAAYAFARLNFRFKNTIFFLFLGTMMVPFQTLMIPTFKVLEKFALIDTLYALIIPSMFSAFSIFMYRQFFLSIPKELESAAKIDGCGLLKIYWEIVMKNSNTVTVTIIIFTFLFIYNDFLRPLIFINSNDLYTLSLGLAGFKGQYSINWSELLAASMITISPMLIVYCMLQKHFMQGMVNSGIKD